ncbi:MAG: phospholipid carrier-dependent glycosyltransferase [Chloroflexi bacterium]|nr:phospholipid carrier-dependent glycosyltransferase [Chloroflexota bacterium]
MIQITRLRDKLVIALVVALIALGLRGKAVYELPVDFDEPTYMLVTGLHYADMVRAGNWQGIIHYDFNTEHPLFNKLVYSGALLAQAPLPDVALYALQPPPPPDVMPQFYALRLVSASFGVLAVGVLALINPIAGMLLALHTFNITYTSQIMLEALPALTSAAAVIAYHQYHQSEQTGWGWLLLSSVALGLTAASKYMYAVAGIAIAVHWLGNLAAGWSKRTWPERARQAWPILAWGFGALLVFFAVNPYLWHAPIGRLTGSLGFHSDFAQSDLVQDMAFPVWQPFLWLTQSVDRPPEIFFIRLDLLISIIALVGFPRLWRDYRVFALWLLLALGFLLLWPTKWAHYILILTFPLCLSAGLGVATLGSWIGKQLGSSNTGQAASVRTSSVGESAD